MLRSAKRFICVTVTSNPRKQIMKRLKIWIFLLFLTSQLFGQDYIEYHRTFNRIDEDVLSQNFTVAIERLDSIYTNYDFIYAQHCMKSLQICCFINDSIRADKWLAKSFKQGIPIWFIRTSELTKKSLDYSTTKETIQVFDSLYSIYKASINLNLASQIDSLFDIDQKYTQKVNDGFILFRHTIFGLKWVINNKKQFKIINNIIDEYGFPGEKLIGLPKTYEDSVSTVEFISFWGSYIREWQAYFMLLHYFSTKRNISDDFKNKLFQNVINGNMTPFQYANICSYIYRHSENSEYESYYGNDTITNRKRLEMGLNTVEQEKRNELIQRERRKNKKANNEIMLE